MSEQSRPLPGVVLENGLWCRSAVGVAPARFAFHATRHRSNRDDDPDGLTRRGQQRGTRGERKREARLTSRETREQVTGKKLGPASGSSRIACATRNLASRLGNVSRRSCYRIHAPSSPSVYVRACVCRQCGKVSYCSRLMGPTACVRVFSLFFFLFVVRSGSREYSNAC